MIIPRAKSGGFRARFYLFDETTVIILKLNVDFGKLEIFRCRRI